MIDFTNCEPNFFKYYGGQNGNKICVKYNNEDYMLKFPNVKDDKDVKQYTNSCVSEYLSCQIINAIGLKAQGTILGKYYLNGKEKIVVACKDFVLDGYQLKQFAELKNSQINSSENGYGTELSEVIETILNQRIYDVKALMKFFWEMFIVDTLLGNFDRHNGNWGFLINIITKEIKIAPIYDCASCLYPQLDDERISEIINDDEEMEARVFVFPNSALKTNGTKINYFNFISKLDNEDYNKALIEIFPKINLETINVIIDNTPFISDIRKDFYKRIIKMRYDKLLKYNYEKLVNNNL